MPPLDVAPVQREARAAYEAVAAEAHAHPVLVCLRRVQPLHAAAPHRCAGGALRPEARCHAAVAQPRVVFSRGRHGAPGRSSVPAVSTAAHLLQEVEREVAPHVAVDLPAGDPAVEARRPGRVDALLDLLDDVQRGRAAEAGPQAPRATRRGS